MLAHIDYLFIPLSSGTFALDSSKNQKYWITCMSYIILLTLEHVSQSLIAPQIGMLYICTHFVSRSGYTVGSFFKYNHKEDYVSKIRCDSSRCRTCWMRSRSSRCQYGFQSTTGYDEYEYHRSDVM